MNITTKKLKNGPKYQIHEILFNGKSKVKDFILGLKPKERAHLMATLDRISQHGPPRNKEKFRHEQDQIYAIKENQIRIYCFFDAGRLLLLTHGIIKKRKKAKSSDLNQATIARRLYLDSKEKEN